MAPSSESAVHTVPAAGGRQLEVLVSGPEDGLPLVFHEGTPGGLVAFPPMVTAAAERGLRTVMYARPGYGASTPQPGRRVADAAADVTAVLDALGAGDFVTAGWSGGGPHALACAALLPGRCRAAATIAGVAPRQADGLDWLAGMGEENLAEFAAAQAQPHRAEPPSPPPRNTVSAWSPRRQRAAPPTGEPPWPPSATTQPRHRRAGTTTPAFTERASPARADVPVAIWQAGTQCGSLSHGRSVWLKKNPGVLPGIAMIAQAHFEFLFERVALTVEHEVGLPALADHIEG